jgi:tyrosine-protein kinase Etk/Wzc
MNLTEILKELEEEESKTVGKKKTNFRLLMFKYLSNWKLFVVCLIFCLMGAFAFTYFSTPQYEVKSILLLKDKEKGADFSSNAVVNDLMGFGSSSSVENEAEVFKSASLMIKACQELGLKNNFYVNDSWLKWKEIYANEVPITVTIAEPYEFPVKVKDNTVTISIIDNNRFQIEENKIGDKGIFSFGDTVSNFFGTFILEKNENYIKALKNENKPIKISFFNPEDLGRALAEDLNVSIVNKLASVIEISLNQEHAAKGTKILEKLIEVYATETDEDKNRTALNTLNFIDEQLVTLTAELEAIERQAERFKLNNAITDVTSESQLFLNSSTVNRQQISELSVQIDVLESIERYVMDNSNDITIVPSSLSIQDQTLNALITDFNLLQRERERMLRSTQPNNPIVQNLNQQIRGLRSNILENIKNIKSGLIISRNRLLETSDQFQSRASRVPTIERELLEINRKQEIKQEHYLLLTRKREEAALSLAATTISNSKIIDPPTATDYPVKPKKLLIYAFGFLMGIGFPLGLIYLKDAFHEQIEFKSDIEIITPTKIIGEISNYSNKKYGVLAVAKGKKNMVAEQFRFIRTNLITKLNRETNKVIMVTSSISGEGKTFFSINLASSLGLLGKSVAVMELDLRKPALLSALGIKTETGISDYLEGNKVKFNDIIIPLKEAENVSVLGCGKIPENPAELMIGDKLHEMITQLSKKYDYVIIDTAPIGLVSDSFMLSDLADITVFMVRCKYSSKAHVKTIEEIRKNKDFKMPVIVLNDSGSYLSYGYGAKYSMDYYHK